MPEDDGVQLLLDESLLDELELVLEVELVLDELVLEVELLLVLEVELLLAELLSEELSALPPPQAAKDRPSTHTHK